MTDRLAYLNQQIALGLGDVPQWLLPSLTRRKRYNLYRRAHPRRLTRRADYEPPEERRQKYLIEKGGTCLTK